MDFVKEAKKAYWAHGRRNTEAFRDKLRTLLLEKLSRVGDIDEDDIAWAEARAQEIKIPWQ
jgi:hypothetical protein